MSDRDRPTPRAAAEQKQYVLRHFDTVWGGWRDMRYSIENDGPATFDTVEAGRAVARDVAIRLRCKTRVVRHR